MNPTKHRNPGRAAARAFAAMALAAASFLAPAAAQAADETTTGPEADASTEEGAPASSADLSACYAMRTAPAGTTATLDRGHADIFDLTSDAAGTLTLRIKEDATGSGVMREPEQTLLAVKGSTLTQIPASVRRPVRPPPPTSSARPATTRPASCGPGGTPWAWPPAVTTRRAFT